MPVIRLAHLTPEQVRAYRIADNKLASSAGWDDELLAAELHALNAAGFDLGLTGFEGEDLDRLLAPLDEGDGLAGEDIIPEPPRTRFRGQAISGCSVSIGCCAATRPAAPT